MISQLIENDLSYGIAQKGSDFHLTGCSCSSCQKLSPNLDAKINNKDSGQGTTESTDNNEMVISNENDLKSNLNGNLSYTDLVWDYQGLKRNIKYENGISENAKYSLYHGPWEFTSTQNTRGHELATIWHTQEQIDFINDIFRRIDKLIDLDFTQVESFTTEDITIFRASSNSDWDQSWFDDSLIGGGKMYGNTGVIDLEWRDLYSDDEFLDVEKSTIVHEIGHALGLSHPGGVGANPDWDEWDSIMSYNDREGVDEEPLWFSDLDIQALQQIWGVEDDLPTQFVDVSSWSRNIKINHNVTGAGEELIQGLQVTKNDFKYDGPTGSIITGGPKGEILRGLGGWDIIDGGGGNDLVHGGNGRDVITGGTGSDELHGDFGWNTYTDQRDGYVDLIAIKSDQLLTNHWYGRSGMNSTGGKCDHIEGLDSSDQIIIIGASNDQLSFRDQVTHKGVTGIGIYAEGALEALYTGGNLSEGQIRQMTSGDASELAMGNKMWSYWGVNTPPWKL